MNLLGVPSDFPQIAFEFILGGGYVMLLFAIFGAKRGKSSSKWALVIMTSIAFILSLEPPCISRVTLS